MSYATEVQIWNNAAFDNGDSEDLTSNRPSWGSLKSTFENPKASFDSVAGKENQGYFLENQISSVSSSLVSPTNTPFKPINTDGALVESRNKGFLRKDDEETKSSRRENGKDIRDDKKIDEEIIEIENEISRLSSRLEALRLVKVEMTLRVSEKRGSRVVPAKFMDQKQRVIAKNAEEKKKIDELSSTNGKWRIQRRGVSLGPSEIVSGVRRGMSMGPSEIFGSTKGKRLGKQEMITPSQSRRKSCFLKLQEIDEEKVAETESVKGSSVSPNSRKVAFKNQVLPRQAVTTIASRKGIKKEDGIISYSIQPKKLFKEAENLVNKKPVKPGRVVASRYNQNNSQASVVRKRSLAENDKDYTKRCEKKRSTSAGKSRVEHLGTESRVKKKQWEIPSEIVVHRSLEDDENSPDSTVVVPNFLPRIRIARCMNESPRDSGPAKRVAELTGKNLYFSNTDGEMEPSICQSLNYAEEDQES
ncbi:uncharacterized protein LOC142539022 [Primulina tabacum]|uniref:uncharacterized protein LOC142539022 n=1 Tax=Primulina tabacum TaxID=48773 RepID=UPI003F5A827E